MKKIVVIGGGESGVGAAVLAHRQGFETLLSDSGHLADRYRERLVAEGIAFEQGGHTIERIVGADLVVKSPGVPETAAAVAAARERGVPVISEIEFAARFTGAARTVCITGANGKTTTTTLIYRMLHDAGYDVCLGGNIGESFALSVAEGAHEWYVLELSSFQLDGMYDFRADIAVLLNITPDHLDRYDNSLAKYAASKMRIVQNQRAEDFFVYNADDAVIAAQMEGRELPMHLLPFAPRMDIFPVGELRLRGLHNLMNAQAAVLAARAAGVPEESIRRTLRGFTGIEHRLEPAGTRDGVEYINDSKATNVDAAWYALESMTRPVVWIAGGTDKGNDYGALMPLVREKVKALVCMGVDNTKLVESFGGVVPALFDTHSLDDAMAAARGAATEGDVVLLSPACASFDLFKNYEDRGQRFKAAVSEL
jgi:UDP-N-acetylmuramoylalanine--D-glutamate ligase